MGPQFPFIIIMSSGKLRTDVVHDKKLNPFEAQMPVVGLTLIAGSVKQDLLKPYKKNYTKLGHNFCLLRMIDSAFLVWFSIIYY